MKGIDLVLTAPATKGPPLGMVQIACRLSLSTADGAHTCSETPAAWTVSPRAYKWLAGGSGDPAEPPPEDLTQGPAVSVEALEGL